MRAVDIDAGNGLELPGILTIPPQPAGAIAFAQGSGTSRLRPPERALARALTMAGYAALLFDLLTMPEEARKRNIFDIPLLTGRLTAATEWLQGQTATSGLALGFIGASTGGCGRGSVRRSGSRQRDQRHRPARGSDRPGAVAAR